MKTQPNRLAIDQRHLLGGVNIDRNLPLRFRLDGRVIHGFEGDTVLSAVIASGIDSVGMRGGSPVALSARFAPPIVPIHGSEPKHALPMTRTPAIDGAEFRTLSSHRVAASMVSRVMSRLRPAPSLGVDLDGGASLSPPWLDAPAAASHFSDVVVVGGGVAGLSAAVAAAHAGRSVTLIEAGPVLGGAARLFGTLEDEETPDQSIGRLTTATAGADAITIVTDAEVFMVRPGLVRAHVVSVESGRPLGRVIEYRAGAIILATGAIERLPVFAGNRLPGVVGVQQAYEMAYRYGVWQGESAVLATVNSVAYRLAMLASDAGIAIGKIVDGRAHPQSRFIEFCKAYGITQLPGMVPAHAKWLGAQKGLSVALQLAIEGVAPTEQPIPALTDSLIVCGGWQPELSLWHMAGGRSQWSLQYARIEAKDGPPGIALAGSAAGYVSKQACLQSGEDAVCRLLGQRRIEVVEHLVDPIYETPDGPTPISVPASEAEPAAYLDAGIGLIERPVVTAPPRWRRYLPFAVPEPPWSLADYSRALSVCDVAAGVQLGAIPASSAGIVAQERAAASLDLVDNARHASIAGPTHIASKKLCPDFLAGRFGPAASLWEISPVEPRALETGALIFINSDQTDPRQAIGIVVRSEDTTTVALIGNSAAQAGVGATVRDQGRPVPIRLGEPLKIDGEASAAPLGGGTSSL